jgi:lysophospholipase L1-like esterase
MALPHRIRVCVLVPCAAALAIFGALTLAPAAGAIKAGNTYLALGDSLAYGYHAAQFEEELASGHVNPETFDEGYVNDFDEVVKLFNPNVKLINDGCPGEGTETMIHGSGVEIAGVKFCGGEDATPFPYAYLHHPYSTSTQLSDALAILRGNPNEVSPITLDIGANDLLHYVAKYCGFLEGKDTCTETQFEEEFRHIGANVAYILGQLRAAAPSAEIIMVGLYNPYPDYPSEGSDRITEGLDKALETAASSVPGPPISFANPLPLFNPSTVLGPPESTDLKTICVLTAMCPEGKFNPAGDIHPTKLGYQVMAGVVALEFLTH